MRWTLTPTLALLLALTLTSLGAQDGHAQALTLTLTLTFTLTVWERKWDTLKVSVPAFCFTLQNNLQFVAASHLGEHG